MQLKKKGGEPALRKGVSARPSMVETQLIDFIDEAAMAIDCQGRVIAWNEAMEKLTRIKAEDILGKTDYEYALTFYGMRRPVLADLVLNPDEEIEKHYLAITRDDDTLTAKIRIARQADKMVLFNAKAKPLYGKDDNIIGAMETICEMTENTKADNALKEIEARYSALFDRSLESVYIHDFNGNFIDVNQATLDILGYTREELLSMSFVSMITEDQYPLAIKVREDILKNGHQRGTSIYKVKKKDGSFVHLETKGALIFREGEPYAIQGVARDITERKETEEALRQSEQKYRNIFENVSDFLYVHDMEGKFLETNLSSKADIGYTAEDIAGMNITDLMPDQYKPFFREYMEDLKKNRKQEGLISILTKEGRERVVEYKNIIVMDSSGNPVCVQGSGRDITRRIKTEKALKISEEKYRNILDSIEEAYFEVDLKGNFTFFNQVLGKYLKYSDDELMGMNYKQYMDKPNAKKVFEMFHTVYITGQPTKAFDWELVDKEGGKIFAEASVALMKKQNNIPAGFRGIVRDINERKEAEKERDRYEMRLSQAQKMEAIGTLAGGIAHDFNNMLSAIIGYTELARNDLPEGSRASMNLDQVLKAGMRARELVNQILSFSRNFETESEGVKVALVMNEALKLLRVTIPTTIDIRDNIECETESVFADPTQIHQIIMNLCTNAYQAMEKGGGILSVGLEPVEMNDMEISDADNLQLAGGPYLKLTVSDTGCGMDEETARNIFDPFFTTKERGKGTGLGLATVHRIVTELKGSIMVESAPGRGTTFVIYLPRIVETN
jgi:two-component system cell cycle sensor histidine kinase/response regulator CckA